MDRKRQVKIYKYTALFEPDKEAGGYTVTIPALPGCITQGDTFEEAVEMAKDAIRCYLGSLKKHGEPMPEESSEGFVGTIDVPVSEAAFRLKR